MTTYRCQVATCRQITRERQDTCPRCGGPLEPYTSSYEHQPKRLARPATPTSDQLAIDEELETWDAYMRRLAAEGGQAR